MAFNLTKHDLLPAMEKVADWQIDQFTYSNTNNLHDAGIYSWTNATLYLGMSHWAGIAGDNKYAEWLMGIGTAGEWEAPANFKNSQHGLFHADELCIIQFYENMYRRYRQPEMLTSSRERLDRIIYNSPDSSMNHTNKQSWTWCDALFMAPPAFIGMWQTTGDNRYLAFADEQFKKTYNHLYHSGERLFYRDDSYFYRKEANGKEVFWGRGNGWVAAGLANILKMLPVGNAMRPFYESLFREHTERLASLQDASGFWHASLLDPKSYPAPETSATALITYAIAYGVNSGLLPVAEYTPIVEKGWKALLTAVNSDGKLGWIQPIGADPKKVTAEMTAVYGVGAFLMAGVEIVNGITSGRETTGFNHDWKFKKGPFPSDPVLFQGSQQSGWQPVSIPHTWNATDMQTYQNIFYEGEGYYKKIYTPDINLQNKRVFLRFEGVASVAEVYVNSQFAGNHKGGYSAFAVELTKLLKYGEKNELLVKVSNESRPDVIPINHTLFGVYGGIYRPVELIITENVNIAVADHASPGVYISQKNVNRKQAEINIRVKLENRNHRKQTVILENLISDAKGKIVARQESEIELLPQGRQTAEQNFVIKNPRLWQGLEDPYLYRVTTQLKLDGKLADEIVQPLGLRHFELKAGDGMYLNGIKTPMYGVCRHQDWWKLGSALTNEQHDADLAIIRELGATTIRLAHYQQSEYFYAKCDSIGLMVWAEIPFVNRVSTKEGENAKQQLAELIRQNYNHPSIYVWGLHNEVYNPINYTTALTADLHDLAKSEDPYRYTVSVNGYGNPGHGVNMNADIQGINRYFGWYERKVQDLETWITGMEKDYPGYKIILAEYGAEANINHQQEIVEDAGDCCGPAKNYNESFATRFHEIQWGYIANHPYLLASYIWNTFDFATPVSHQGGVPARNMKGLVTFDRKIKKDPFYWYKANWSKEPVLYITQRRVIERENKTTSVTVYSNVGIPKLYVNGNEITNYKTGTTAVHYIFENVELHEGKNEIAVKAVKDSNTLEDSIYWIYSKDRKSPENIKIEEKNQEHTGL